MFGFGANKKVALIKELVETRLQLRGISTVESRVYIKSLGLFNSFSLPEGTIVAIIEAAVHGQKKGILLHDILHRQENIRRSMGGSNAFIFDQIIKLCIEKNPADALLKYCVYRNEIENNSNPAGIISEDEFMVLIPIAFDQIIKW